MSVKKFSCKVVNRWLGYGEDGYVKLISPTGTAFTFYKYRDKTKDEDQLKVLWLIVDTKTGSIALTSDEMVLFKEACEEQRKKHLNSLKENEL